MIVIDLEFGVSRTKEDQAEDLLLYRGHRWRRRSGDRGQQQAYPPPVDNMQMVVQEERDNLAKIQQVLNLS
jgi:hypothetical protein